jgi:dienelactone hydrolase
MLSAYFQAETQQLSDACLADIKTLGDLEGHRNEYRQELREMLGLDPLPPRTALEAVVTGKVEREGVIVEKVYFQSRPHLYVTGNLYLPAKQSGTVPAVLYLCGHSNLKKNGVSYGAKVTYQHHGAWFAQNGYACLVIDTLQLGEIEGLHHGTNREGMWWWNSRGYTPAGVETWNAIRAIDYLVSRPEVDAERIGVTGRSGGGAYSWFVTALDDRVKVAVPAAGITTVKNHIVDGCIEGHCDCMFFVNAYRWDFAQLAALAAPRPLLIANTDRDKLFPLDGVMDIYRRVRRIYESQDDGPSVALQIAAGPHEDGQVLQLHAMQWFNQHLKKTNLVVNSVAKDVFEPEELRVFEKLPADQINTQIHETFVRIAATPKIPNTVAEWERQRDEWLKDLREKSFRGWPREVHNPEPRAKAPLKPEFDTHVSNVRFCAYDFDSQPNVRLRLYLLLPSDVPPAKLEKVALRVMTESEWAEFLAAMQIDCAKQLDGEDLPKPSTKSYKELRQILAANCAVAFIAPRGIGPTAWSGNEKQRIHIRRRFMLLGQTLDGMRIWDTRRAMQTLRSIEGFAKVPLSLVGQDSMAGVAMYAALFEPEVAGVYVGGLPASHRDGIDLLNVQRYLDMPQVVAMVAEHSHVRIEQNDPKGWEYPLAVSKKLGWTTGIEIEAAGE